ncbi:Hypothetical protein FKW44_019630, partial [Caligus rogercresseyi]
MEEGKRRRSLLRRRSSIASSNVPFEDQLSLISPDLPPEEHLRKLFHLCVRATAHSLKEKGEIEEETFGRFLGYERRPEEAPIAPRNLTPVILRNRERLKGIEGYVVEIERELSSWNEELEKRQSDYFVAKSDYKASQSSSSSSSSSNDGNEALLCKNMKNYLESIDESIAKGRSMLREHSLR